MTVRPTNHVLALVATTFLVGWAFTEAAAQDTQRRRHILLLFQQQAETPKMVAFAQRIGATVRDGAAVPVELYQESLDFDRFASRERWAPLARYLADKYRGTRLDVIVPVGGLAVQFATERLRIHLPDVPVEEAVPYERRDHGAHVVVGHVLIPSVAYVDRSARADRDYRKLPRALL